MINQKSSDVIVSIAFEPVTVRFAGADRKVLRPSVRGFSTVEFDDGEVHPISNPLEEWFLGLINRSAGVGTVYFEITGPGARSNEGQGTANYDVTNIQTSMGD